MAKWETVSDDGWETVKDDGGWETVSDDSSFDLRNVIDPTAALGPVGMLVKPLDAILPKKYSPQAYLDKYFRPSA